MAPKSSIPTTVADVTRLDTDVNTPATTAPGDAPADTTDPTERASTVIPQPTPETLLVGTVNGVLPLPPVEQPADDGDARWEEYPATRPNGDKVTVRHNLDTGETQVS